MPQQDDMTEPGRELEITRLPQDGRPFTECDHVIAEEVLTVEVEGVGSYDIMHTPVDSMALAVGFAFTEGIIEGIDDIGYLHKCPDDASVVRIRLCRPPEKKVAERNLAVVSSCGICGAKGRVEQFLSEPVRVGDTLRVSSDQLQAVHDEMLGMQRIYAETGGAHAAAIFDAEGRIVSFAEDIGRHNALDKVIGKSLMEKRVTKGCGVALSSRVSFELVAKAVRAGIELIAAVSVPSSLAVAAAEKCNVTIYGFRRKGRASVHTHPRRLTDTEQE